MYCWICIQSFKRFIFCFNCVYNSWKYVCIHIKQQMLGVNENSACTFHIRWNEFQGQLNDFVSKDWLKRPIAPFLEVRFGKFFDSHMYYYIGKLKMTIWNRFDTDWKNGWAVFTCCISFTDPFLQVIEEKICIFHKQKTENIDSNWVSNYINFTVESVCWFFDKFVDIYSRRNSDISIKFKTFLSIFSIDKLFKSVSFGVKRFILSVNV